MLGNICTTPDEFLHFRMGMEVGPLLNPLLV